MERNPQCTLCPLHEQANTVCMAGHGPANPKLVIVGEAPGREEDQAGRPFIGQAGKLLRGLLTEAGIDPEQAFITNSARCRPPGNRAPTKPELKACKPYLQAELARVAPKYVLLLGNTALHYLGKTGITKLRGQPMEGSTAAGQPVTFFATFHPAAALRDPGRLPAIQQDLKALADLMSGKVQVKPDDITYTLVDHPAAQQAFIEAFRQCRTFAFDLETTSLEYYRPQEQINCAGFCLDGDSLWVLVPPFIQPTLIQLPADKYAIAHNGKFDQSWFLAKYNFRFNLRFDTFLAAHLLDENRELGLKTLARTLCGAPDYDLTKKDKLGLGLDPHKLYRYCALDTLYTHKLYVLFNAQLRQQSALRKLFFKLIMPVARLYELIEQSGLYVDRARFAKTEKELAAQHTKLERELQALSGTRRKVNWNSPQQIGDLLFNKLGLPVLAYTPTGNPSTGEDILNLLQEEHPHPILHKLLEYRGVQKMLSTYIEGWKPLMYRGRVYMPTKIAGTVTGRFSSRLHQVPREGTIRNLITAPEGWTLVVADFSQIELRLMAEVSSDRNMKLVFQTGGDIHTQTAQQVLGITGEPTKDDRRKAKGINFGFVYGMSAKKFRLYAKTEYGATFTEDEAYSYRNRYFQTYPAVLKYHAKQRSLVRAQGYVTNLLGRKRRLPTIYSEDPAVQGEAERQAINSPIQGFGSGDLKALAMLAIAQRFSSGAVRLKGEVHDSVLMEVKTDMLNQTLPEIKKLMECPPALKEDFDVVLVVPIAVDMEVGPWGAGEKV